MTKHCIAVLLILLSAIISAGELRLNDLLQEKGLTQGDGAWKFSRVVDLIKEDSSPELRIAPEAIRKHQKTSYIRGYNGDVTLAIKAPGPITRLDISGVISNFPDRVTREASIAYSRDGVNYTEIDRQFFGGKYNSSVTIGKTIDVPKNNGLLFVKFQRYYEKGDKNGQYGFVVWQKFTLNFEGAEPSFNEDADERAVKINNRVPSIGFVENRDSWQFTRIIDLVKEDPPAEMLISPNAIRKHPKTSYIRGYNGDVTLLLRAPGPIAHLDFSGVISNFPDKVTREASVAYSLDGLNFTEIDRQAFGGKYNYSVTVGKKIDAPKNNGRLYIKFQRHYEKGDRNGQYGFVVWQKFNVVFDGTYFPDGIKPQSVKKTGLKNAFPTGVFWALERTGINAAYAGVDYWTFVEQNMETMKENGYDTCWLINGGVETQPRMLQLAEKHGLRVLLYPDMNSFIYNGGTLDDLDRMAERTAMRYGDSPALLGYLGKDEPGLFDVTTLSYFHDLMKKYDPERDSVSVVQNRMSLGFLRDSKLPVVCSDIYYFGSDNSTQLPCPRKRSQWEFTMALDGYVKMAELTGKHSWFMGQMFGDIWGLHWFNGKKLVVYPGCYLHWRMPTQAESRWQIWEALRLGCKGIFFYVFHPSIPLEVEPEKATTEADKRKVEQMKSRAASAASWKNQKLTTEKIELDQQGGMLLLGGKASPQMIATRGVNKLIRDNEELLVNRRRADFPVLFADDPDTDTATFVSGKRYIGVVVNRDLDKTRTIQVLLPLNVKSVYAIDSKSPVAIEPYNDHFRKFSVTLEAGSGALVEVKFYNHPGMLLCHESFYAQLINRVTVNRENAEIINFGNMGVDEHRCIRLKAGADATQPVCRLKGFGNPKTVRNTFSKNIGRKSGTYYMLINGQLNACTVKALNAQQHEVKTNTMHLQNFQQEQDARSQGTVIQSREFYRPAILPGDTTEVEFYLKGGYISDIQIWYVPAEQG